MISSNSHQINATTRVTAVGTEGVSPHGAQKATRKKPLPVSLAALNSEDSFINGELWFPHKRPTRKAAPKKVKKRTTVTRPNTLKQPKQPQQARNIRMRSPTHPPHDRPPNSPFDPFRSEHELVGQTSYRFEKEARNDANQFQRSRSESSWATVDEDWLDMLQTSNPASSNHWPPTKAYTMEPQSPLFATPGIFHPLHKMHSQHPLAPPNLPNVNHGPQSVISSQVLGGTLSAFITSPNPKPHKTPSEYRGSSEMALTHLQGYPCHELNSVAWPANLGTGTMKGFDGREPGPSHRQIQPYPELLGYYASDPQGSTCASDTQQYGAHLVTFGDYGDEHFLGSLER